MTSTFCPCPVSYLIPRGHHQVHWATCMAWHWRPGTHPEGEKSPLVWTRRTLQRCSQDSLWHTSWMESMGLGSPRWLGSSWQRGLAENGSSRLSTLMIETPGDLVWDLPCVQQASYMYLEGGPLMWILPLYLHLIKKNNDHLFLCFRLSEIGWSELWIRGSIWW